MSAVVAVTSSSREAPPPDRLKHLPLETEMRARLAQRAHDQDRQPVSHGKKRRKGSRGCGPAEEGDLDAARLAQIAHHGHGHTLAHQLEEAARGLWRFGKKRRRVERLAKACHISIDPRVLDRAIDAGYAQARAQQAERGQLPIGAVQGHDDEGLGALRELAKRALAGDRKAQRVVNERADVKALGEIASEVVPDLREDRVALVAAELGQGLRELGRRAPLAGAETSEQTPAPRGCGGAKLERQDGGELRDHPEARIFQHVAEAMRG